MSRLREAAGDAAVEFDQAVDGFGAAVVGAGGVEVGQERVRHCFRVLPRRAISGIGQVGKLARIFSASRRPAAGLSGGRRCRSCWAHCQATNTSTWRSSASIAVASRCCWRSVSRSRRAAQDVPDPVERVVLAAAVAVDVLLDAAADLVDGLGAELHHMERVEHRDGVVELVVDGVLVAVERVQGGDLDPGAERVAAGLRASRRRPCRTGRGPGRAAVPGCVRPGHGSDRPSRSTPSGRARSARRRDARCVRPRRGW